MTKSILPGVRGQIYDEDLGPVLQDVADNVGYRD